MAERRIEAARPRGPGRPFRKGVSGNLGGRPKGFARHIQAPRRDGEELVTHVLAVLRDEATKPADRLTAATRLAGRGFGRPAQTVAPADMAVAPIQLFWHGGTPA